MTARLLVGGARVLTPGGEWPRGWIAVEGRRIVAMGQGDPPPRVAGGADVLAADGLVAMPGFIDLHAHGAVGADVMDADPDGLRRMARFFAGHGVTAWLAATMTATGQDIERALEAVSAAAGPIEGGATLLGAYLEGPYLNADRAGAQDPDLIRPADRAEATRLLDRGVVRVLAVAPEVEENRWLVAEAAARGLTVSAGHTDATYDQALQALEDGVRHVTHAFNAMRPLGHREPGLLGAALVLPELRCELIADNVHVHPAAMRLLFAAKGPAGVVLVSDALRATGLPEGAYTVGGRPAFSMDGAIRLADGTLAGSVLTLDRALHNLQAATSRPLAELWPAASRNAAQAIGVDDAKGTGGVVLVSDAMRATGLPDGAYTVGDRPAFSMDGAIRLGDGTLAGSVLTLDRALHNLQAATGRPLAELWPAASRNAAQAIGVDDAKGTLEPGKDADLVLLDPALRVVVTVAEGAVVHGRDRLQRHPAPAGRAPPE